jgi:hypothetical protein
MKLVIEVEDDTEAAVQLVSWIRGRRLSSEGEMVRIGRTQRDTIFASRILNLSVEFGT